jgi:hypothetical protein
MHSVRVHAGERGTVSCLVRSERARAMNFQKPYVVSVWVGRFDSPSAFEGYVAQTYDSDGNSKCQFAEHAGLGWFDHDFQEGEFFERPGFVTDLQGFSYAASFLEAMSQQLAEGGDWNSILLLYDCEYDSSRAHPSRASRLRFVGSFPYQGSEQNPHIRTTIISS